MLFIAMEEPSRICLGHLKIHIVKATDPQQKCLNPENVNNITHFLTQMAATIHLNIQCIPEFCSNKNDQ